MLYTTLIHLPDQLHISKGVCIKLITDMILKGVESGECISVSIVGYSTVVASLAFISLPQRKLLTLLGSSGAASSGQARPGLECGCEGGGRGRADGAGTVGCVIRATIFDVDGDMAMALAPNSQLPAAR